MKIRAIIVDDEAVARSRLRRLLQSAPDVEVVAECADGAAALAAIREQAPQLVLLDIQMPGMTGFDMLDEIPHEQRPAVIFVTAFDEHAVRAFDECALDYLLKPVDPERLMKSIDRIAARLAGGQGGEPQPAQTRFLVRNQGRVEVVTTDLIEWIEAAGNYAILHTGKENHIIRQTMNSLEARLPESFLRVSRSAILNLRCVVRCEANAPEGHQATMRSGQKVTFTRKFSEVSGRL